MFCLSFRKFPEHKTRVLSAADEGIGVKEEGVIKLVTEKGNYSDDFRKPQLDEGKREDPTKETKNTIPILDEQVIWYLIWRLFDC